MLLLRAVCVSLFPALPRLPIFLLCHALPDIRRRGGAVASLRLGSAVWLSLVWSVAFGTQKSEVQILLVPS